MLSFLQSRGFVEIVHLERSTVQIKQGNGLVLPDFELLVSNSKVQISLCADTASSLALLASDLLSAPAFQAPPSPPSTSPPSAVAPLSRRVPKHHPSSYLLSSLDPAAFQQAQSIHDLPEILDDDVPTNFDYLTDALHTHGSRTTEFRDRKGAMSDAAGVLISEIEGETIRMLHPQGIVILDNYLAYPRAEEEENAASTYVLSQSLSPTNLSDTSCDCAPWL